jgi:hypothetical protein
VARRLCGTDPAEIRDAFGALFRVRSPADVRRLVEESPTVRSPAFLTALRLNYMRAVPEMTDQRLRESFLHIYDDLLFALHDRPGPLIAGLVPAFLAGGAGHVLAALWPLDDEAAMTFQTAFYRELARDGHPPGRRSPAAGAWPARVRWARPYERPRRGPAMCCTASEEGRT